MNENESNSAVLKFYIPLVLWTPGVL